MWRIRSSLPAIAMPIAVTLFAQDGASPSRRDGSPPGYEWTRVRPFASGSWQESWSPGTVPLALIPVVGPAGQLWMVGGRGVWRSDDGSAWTRATASLPWGDRYGATPVFFRGELWALGGEENRVKMRDAFRSSDGVRWARATDPTWSARRWHSATVFNDKLWVIGGLGSAAMNDVWASADGVSWQRVMEHAPWPARSRHAAVVWRDRLCILGGSTGDRELTDVWCSRDGTAWTKLADRAWSPRMFPGVQVFDGRLWVFGGSWEGVGDDSAWLNDVRVSDDGATWTEQTAHAPWSRRAAEYSVVFRDRLWIFGGKGIESTGRGGFADDVWSLRRVAGSG